MSKDLSPTRRTAPDAKAEDADNPSPPGDLAQTEAFPIDASGDEDAADFLLGMDEAGGLKEISARKPKRLAVEKTEGAGGKASEQSVAKPRAARPAARDDKTEVAESAGQSAASNQATVETKKEAKQTILGDYRLIKKLGQGGMGSVYKAHQISLDRECAVKILAKELASKPAFVERFKREARVMAKLDHPNILRCYEVNSAQGYHYLSMEYVDGGSVDGWVKKVGRLSIGDAMHIILGTARALEHAHEQGLMHRDVKPDNVLLTSAGVLKLADLGLAKATDEDMGLTKTGTGAGTPYYMAPEQARDAKHVDQRVDIYALGVMLYGFLTGVMPFKGTTLVEVIEAKEKGKFPSIRKFNDEAPEKLDLIVGKMLAPKPEHRYATCTEVIADLEQFELANEQLSFLNAGDDSGTVKVQAAAPAAKAAQKPAAAAATQPAQAVEPKPSDPWYWTFTGEDGKKVTKKLSKEQLITLIKSGSIDTDAQVSRQAKTGFRAVGTYGEFLPHLQKNIISEKIEKKSEKYREMYKQIEAEEKSRLRWRWFHNLYLKLGGGVGFIIWMCIIAAVVVGGIFGVKWLIEYLGTTVADKAGLK